DEIALECDAEARLLERLADRAVGGVLVRLDAAAGRPPDVEGEVRRADQGDSLFRVEDEERHVVEAARVVGGDAPFDVADLAVPRECGGGARPPPGAGGGGAGAPR